MKSFLNKVFMLITIIGYAQNDSTLVKDLELLQKPAEFQFSIDNSGYSKIESSQFYSKRGDTDAFIINPKDIHFLDFNNDGYKDIIYQDTRHYQATIIFVKKGNDFKEIWSGPGKLIEVKQGKETTVYVIMNFIGCSPISILNKLIIHNDNSITESSISYHYKTIIENTDVIFEQKNVSGILRTQPVLDNKELNDPCTGGSVIGNQLRTIENKEITIIKKQKDWLLVVYKDKSNSIVSWIKN